MRRFQYLFLICLWKTECGPWNVLHNLALMLDGSNWTIPLVSSGYKKIDWLWIDSYNLILCQIAIRNTHLTKLVWSTKHIECSPPSDVAVKGNLQRIHDTALNLKLFENFNSLTQCLNLLWGSLESVCRVQKSNIPWWQVFKWQWWHLMSHLTHGCLTEKGHIPKWQLWFPW